MRIIGVTGTLGAGKNSIINYLKQKSFAHYSAREYIVEEVKRRGRAVNRDMMTLTANELREEGGAGAIAQALYEKAEGVGKDAVIESIRAIGEVEFLRAKPGFFLISIDAPPEVRYKRIQKRALETDHISYEKFLADEKREMHNTDPTKQNIAAVMEQADFSIPNSTTLEDLHRQIDIILRKINERLKM